MDRTTFLKYLGWAGFAGMTLSAGERYEFRFLPKDIIRPARLSRGSTIGLISPASILPERDRYQAIIETIESLGFDVKIGVHAKDRYGYLAGHDKQRAADLNAMFSDPAIDAIIPFRGGWGSNRILEYIDFEAIQQNPKPLIGFSDITSLLLSIFARTGLVTFHGPVGKSEWTDFTVRHFQTALMHPEPFTLHNPPYRTIRTIRSGKARGPLLGGNLTVLTSMLGSNYLPDFSGAILFLEDIGEDVYRIDRMLTQLKLNGILDEIKGLVFGQCIDCRPSHDYSLTLQDVLNDHLLPLEIPAFTGSMIGHIDDMFTLPVGLPTNLDSDAGSLTFLQPAVG